MLDLDFDFAGADRESLLAGTGAEILALGSEMGDEGAAVPGSGQAASEVFARLLGDLNGEVARFTAPPEVYALREETFAKAGIELPFGFADLTARNRLYWMRFPITLWPHEGNAFVKIECAIELNPGADDALRGRIQTVLPDRRFADRLKVDGSLEIVVGPTLEFSAATGPLAAGSGAARIAGSAGVEAKAAGHAGMVAGPFTYRMRTATVDHSAVGGSTILWRISDGDFLRGEDDPTFIVVAQVPNEAPAVRVAAVLQAYHREALGNQAVRNLMGLMSGRSRRFLEAGAPIATSELWDDVAAGAGP